MEFPTFATVVCWVLEAEPQMVGGLSATGDAADLATDPTRDPTGLTGHVHRQRRGSLAGAGGP